MLLRVGVCGVCGVYGVVVVWWCGGVWCVVCGVARLGTQKKPPCGFKTSPCVPAPRANVLPHLRVVPVHTGTFRVYTRRFFGRTHREEGCEEGEGRGVIASSAYHETAHVELSRASERFTERNLWILPIQGLRIDREQHVPESSNHLLIPDEAVELHFHPEGHCGGNQL